MKFALVVCFAALVACEPEAKPEAAAEPWLAYGYGAYAHPYAHHGYYGKRSADAEPEADPALLYGAYSDYAYSGLYNGYAGYHAGYPYAHAYAYGKRSADAEPKAEAEADAYYGYYPYAYGGYRAYGYGAYPYAHHGYAYGKRSADAEPKAEAEADALYGYYGYAHRPYYAGYHAGYPYTYAGYRGYHWG